MAVVRRSLEQLRAGKPRVDRAKLEATSEQDIRRHQIEDGQDPRTHHFAASLGTCLRAQRDGSST